MQDLTDKIALVTGGGRGVGRAVARRLAARGAHVIVNYFHSAEAARALVSEMQSQGSRAEGARASVAKREQVAEMFAGVRARHGRLDILVNNAASGALRAMAELDSRDWTRAIDTNLKGSLWCAEEAASLMPPGGAIVNMSFIGAPYVMDNYLAVGATKSAVEALTRYLAVEYAPLGVRVNTASGGLLEGRVSELFPQAADLKEVVAAATPLGRLGTEDELARLVLFLASAESAWITGQTILADGGLSLGSVVLSPHKTFKASAGVPSTAAGRPAAVPPVPEPQADDTREHPAGLAVAVVGMGMAAPDISTPEDYWHVLHRPEPVFTEPDDRWALDGFYSPDVDAEDRTYVRASGYVRQLDPDPVLTPAMLEPHFDYTARWLRHALGQALRPVSRRPDDRHALVVGYTADGSQHLEESLVRASVEERMTSLLPADSARHAGSRLLRERVEAHLQHAGPQPDGYLPHRVGRDAVQGLVPADSELLMLDTACSSSLYAIDVGMRALREGSCDIALCGGSFALAPRGSTLFSKLHGLTPTEDVRAFDAGANGVLFSDGAAVVVLKTLERARSDGDEILGVLAAVGTSSDGKGKAIYAPNSRGQRQAIERTLALSGIDRDEVDWVVAHATGTPAGDEAELRTLVGAYGRQDGCLVTSNKSLIGHTGWVAGVASVVHTLLALKHDEIPAQQRFDALPSWASDAGARLVVPTSDVPWTPQGRPRTAGVSGFGFGGTNGHLLLREDHPSLRRHEKVAPPDGDELVLVGWSCDLPEQPRPAELRAWLLGEEGAAAPAVAFGDHPALPPFSEIRLPPATLRVIDRCQIMVLRCVLGLDEAVRSACDRLRDTTGVIAGHMGPTRNATLYGMRTYLRDLELHLLRPDDGPEVRSAFEQYAAQVRELVPAATEDAEPGIMPNVIPSRVANYFDYRGLNATVDTGTGSTLSALSMAARYLAAGELDIALVLGVNGNSTPELRRIVEPLLPSGRAALAEGAFLLAVTRPELAEREQLPVIAHMRVSRADAPRAAVIRTGDVAGHASYLAGDSAVALLRAALGAGPATVTAGDPPAGHGPDVHVEPAEATGPERPKPATRSVERHVLTLHEDRGVSRLPATSAVPAQTLLVTNVPDQLARGLPDGTVVLAPGRGDPDAVLATGLRQSGSAIRHVRVVARVDESWHPEHPGFERVLALHDLAFTASQAGAEALRAGGTHASVLFDADATAPPGGVGLFTGLTKTLSQEFPGRLVYAVVSDIDDPSLALAQLATESRRGRILPVVHLEGTSRRLVPLLKPASVSADGHPALTSDSVLVAAGGSRGITAAILQRLASTAKPKIWVLGSNPVEEHPEWVYEGSDEDFGRGRADFFRRCKAEGDPRPVAELSRTYDRYQDARATVANLRRLGEMCGEGRVRYLPCDLVDAAAVERVVEAIRTEDRRIDLMLFAAGVSRTALLEKKSLEDFRRVRDVKVRGHANLRRALAATPPRRWCNFGSLIGYSGQAGEVDYAAGNDYLTTAARSRGRTAAGEFTVGWTLWSSTGLGSSPLTRAFLERNKFAEGMPTEEGVELFCDELRGGEDAAVFHLGRTELDTMEERFPGFLEARGRALGDGRLVNAPGNPPRRPVFELHRVVAGPAEASWEVTLDASEHRWLRGHTADGRPTLPGTFVLELAGQAARELHPDLTVVGFEDALFRRFVKLHPRTGTARLRVRAARSGVRGDERRVRVEVTSDIRAPDGRLLQQGRLHYEVDVLLAPALQAAPRWPGPQPGGDPVRDGYHFANPAVHLSGSFCTSSDTRKQPGLSSARLDLSRAAADPAMQGLTVPALTMDAMARVAVMQLAEGDRLPIAALSSVDAVTLYDGRSDAQLHEDLPDQVRLLAVPEPDGPPGTERAFRCVAVAPTTEFSSRCGASAEP